jgi:hypothetical protein
VSGEGAKIRTTQYVPAGTDRFQGKREVYGSSEVSGSRAIDVKVSALDTNGGLCVAETSLVGKGGTARHLHHEQEEWFYSSRAST